MNIRTLHCNADVGFPVRKKEHIDCYKIFFSFFFFFPPCFLSGIFFLSRAFKRMNCISLEVSIWHGARWWPVCRELLRLHLTLKQQSQKSRFDTRKQKAAFFCFLWRAISVGNGKEHYRIGGLWGTGWSLGAALLGGKKKDIKFTAQEATWLKVELLTLQFTFFPLYSEPWVCLGASNNSFWGRAESAKKEDALGFVMSDEEVERVISLKFQNWANRCWTCKSCNCGSSSCLSAFLINCNKRLVNDFGDPHFTRLIHSTEISIAAEGTGHSHATQIITEFIRLLHFELG